MITQHKDRKQKNGQGNFPNQISAAVYGKVPPQAPELEEAILGAILLEKSAYDVSTEIITAESFYKDTNLMIYEACKSLSEEGYPIDLLTVTAALNKAGNLEKVGGAYYLTSLTQNVVSAANLETHCRIIQEKYMQREVIRLAGIMLNEGYNDSTDVFDLLDFTEAGLFELTTGIVRTNYAKSGSLAKEAIDRIHFLMQHKSEITGVPTGYAALDKLTCGWQPTDLIILAARPSVGKTALALNFAIHAASHKIKPTGVGIFSLEMSAGQLTDRILSSISQVELGAIRRGRLVDFEQRKVDEAAAKFSKLNICIDDTGGINIYSLRTKARRMVSRDNVGLLIIDYLQLMEGTGDRYSNREQEVSKISRQLKALAKELKVPIIALSQLNRSVETRSAGRKPQLSDLRESGAIEQDADVVAFLTRPDYQLKEGEVNPAFKDDALMIFGKHRNGSLEDLAFKTKLSTQTWFDLDEYALFATGTNKSFGNADPNIFKTDQPF